MKKQVGNDTPPLTPPKEGDSSSLVKTRFYLVLPILTGSTCQDKRYEVEPCTNAGNTTKKE